MVELYKRPSIASRSAWSSSVSTMLAALIVNPSPGHTTTRSHSTRARWFVTSGATVSRRRNSHQLPPPPPPPPPPENPPLPNPLDEPELGGDDAIALERLAFIDWRLLESSTAWKGPGPGYQLLG